MDNSYIVTVRVVVDAPSSDTALDIVRKRFKGDLDRRITDVYFPLVFLNDLDEDQGNPD